MDSAGSNGQDASATKLYSQACHIVFTPLLDIAMPWGADRSISLLRLSMTVIALALSCHCYVAHFLCSGCTGTWRQSSFGGWKRHSDSQNHSATCGVSHEQVPNSVV